MTSNQQPVARISCAALLSFRLERLTANNHMKLNVLSLNSELVDQNAFYSQYIVD